MGNPQTTLNVMNRQARDSLRLGICSILPYLIIIIVYHFAARSLYVGMGTYIVLLCFWWGIVFGLGGIIMGFIAVLQIILSRGMESGVLAALLGMILGGLAVASDFFVIYAVLLPT